VAGSNFPLADRNWHGWERNDLAADGPVAHVTLYHGAGHESAIIYRAYTGEISVETPMAVLRERATADSGSGHGQTRSAQHR
jgi:hypothetical protein